MLDEFKPGKHVLSFDTWNQIRMKKFNWKIQIEIIAAILAAENIGHFKGL